jgi:hypothetical protein
MCRKFLGAAVLTDSLGGAASADEQADAKAILHQGITAQGDEVAQSKFVAVSVKSKGTLRKGGKRAAVSFGCSCQGFDKMRILSLDDQDKLDKVQIINGREGWVKDNDQPTEALSGERLEARREFAYVTWATTLVPLKADGFRLSLLDETTVAGRKAVGILVSHDKHVPLKLYFDEETHLLVKYERKYKDVDGGKEVDEECVCSDYRNVQEKKQPFRFEGLSDGVKVIDLVITELKWHDKPLDDKLFSKP